jgi:hypothetical protein
VTGGGLLRRFVASAPPERSAAAVPPPARPNVPASPPTLGVVAAPAFAAAAGAAVALAAARAVGARVALACVWCPDDARERASVHGPALPGARRLATTLAARGHEVRAAGRLVLVRLSADEAGAAAEAPRVVAAAGAAVGVVVTGARSEVLDAVLAAQDALVLWPEPDAPARIGELALASLQRLGRPAVAVEANLGARSRALALAGVAAPAGACDPVRAVLA